MKHPKPDRKYLIVAGITPLVGDILITLCAQPPSYWSQGFEHANETHPIGRYALETHPAVFITGAILYATLLSMIVYYSPKVVAWWLSIGLLIAHTGGMKSWVPRFADWHYYFYWEAGLNALAATLAAWCYLMASKTIFHSSTTP